MGDEELPQSIGESVVLPLVLSEKQREICKRLDELHAVHSLQVRASEIFKGAIFASRPELRSNPDWISQVSNSLRETLYPFYSDEVKQISGTKEQILLKYGSVRASEKWLQWLGTVYGQVEGLTHHGAVEKNHTDYLSFTPNDFDKLFNEFENALLSVLTKQIDVHREIDQFLEQDPENSKEQIKKAKELITLNTDAQQYFFFKSDAEWLQWLWDNGFLDRIKEKAEDPTRYSFRMPELSYLDSVSEKDAKGVAQIILQVPISNETFNPEVIDRFLRIIGRLPSEELPAIVRKIHSEKWEQLMFGFQQHWFEYKDIFEKLLGVKDYSSVLTLSESALSVRPKNDKEERERIWGNNPFLIDNLFYTNVFNSLINIDNEHLEDVLALLAKTMGKMIIFSARTPEKEGLFPIEDGFYLYDIDFFSLSVGKEEGYSSKDNTHNLAATLKLVAQKIFAAFARDQKEIRRIYQKYIQTLPESSSMLRFRLFTFSLAPDEFKAEIEEELFRGLSSGDMASEVSMHPEYFHLLQKCFSVLSETRKHKYVAKALELFGTEKGWKSMGNRIFSCVSKELKKDELEAVEKLFGKLNPEYIPEPSFGHSKGGTVVPQAPGTEEEWRRPISEILERLSRDWSPSALNEKQRDEDFLRPIDADGTGDRLKALVRSRPEEVIPRAEQFFDRERISSHYTYSFLRGVYDLVREKKEAESEIDIRPVLSLMRKMMESDSEDPFAETKGERAGLTWIADWQSVKYAMADVLKISLSGKYEDLNFDFPEERSGIIALIKYLIARPVDLGETQGIELYADTDPFSKAINSVQGRAFEALTSFVYQDGVLLKQSGVEVKIAEDVRQFYKEIVEKGGSLAMSFLLGHYSPTFYYRDIDWFKTVLPLIFPDDPMRKDEYLAALEGYLANNLYQEMFHDIDILRIYERAIPLSPSEYSKRKYFRDIDEGIAIHLALAFVHYEDFNLVSQIFEMFWGNKNAKRHKEFISFVGRHAISRDTDSEDGNVRNTHLEKLRGLWDWTLKNTKDPEILSAFGYWINPSKNIFEVKWLAQKVRETLELSKGEIDWEVGLTDQLPHFSKEAPEDTILILRIYLLSDRSEGTRWVRVDENLTKVFTILYENISTKLETERLINDLISQKGNQYWDLKKIIDSQPDQTLHYV